MRAQLIDNVSPVRQVAITENDDDFVPMRARVLTTNDWKVVRYGGTPFGELYDRQTDPNEEHNLWNHPAYAEVQTELTQRLLDELLYSVDTLNGRVQIPRPLSGKWLGQNYTGGNDLVTP